MIEIEIQNETNQSQERVRFAAVPRIGEGIRLKGPDGFWASFDVLDLWYQKAEFGDIWMPYLHVRMTDGESAGRTDEAATDFASGIASEIAKVPPEDEVSPDDEEFVEEDGIEEWRMASLTR